MAEGDVSVGELRIAATARAQAVAVYTRDRDFDELSVDVVRV